MTDAARPRVLSMRLALIIAIGFAAATGAGAAMLAFSFSGPAGIAAAVLLCIGALLLLDWQLRRMIIAPLYAVADAAHAMDDERRSVVRAGRATVSELDDLAIGFNTLLDELDDWRQQVSTAHEALVHRANFDALSGLPNRASFVEAVRSAIKLSQRSGDRFAILFMDGDRFKETNDRFGHAAGDRVIAEIAARLSPLLRVGDMAARLGGDEFAVLIHHLEDIDNADAVIGRITAAMEQPIALPGNDSITVGLSIGMAIFPDHGDSVETLINHADAAMYAAKNERKSPR